MLLAQIENPVLKGNLKNINPAQVPNFLGKVIGSIVTFFVIAAIIFFVFSFFLGGISWIMSQGEEAKIKTARDKITSSLVGLLIVFSIFALLRLIGYLFGLTGLERLELPLIPLI